MGERKPNILEVDGIIIRGRNGEPRASITMQEGREEGREDVWFEMFGEDAGREPVFSVIVGPDGTSELEVGYVTKMEGESCPEVFGGVKLSSGDAERAPRLAIWGRDLPHLRDVPIIELPERSEDGIRLDVINGIRGIVRKYAARHGESAESIMRLLESAEWAHRCETETEVAS